MSPTENSSQPYKLRYLSLFVVSCILLLWHHFGMSVRLDVIPSLTSTLEPKIHSDRINGGVSKTELNVGQGQIHLGCEIILSDTFAFCGVTQPLVEKGAPGLDMSIYSEMHIELEYESTQNDTLLVYLNNEEQQDNSEILTKDNLWADTLKPGINQFTFTPKRFFIPSWWIFKNSQHGDIDTEPNISNVVSISFTTGDNTEARNVKMSIKSVFFTGKWIERDTLYLGLMIAWLSLILLDAILYVHALSLNIKQSSDHNRYLLKLNQFLNIQKDQYESLAKTDKLTGALNRTGARDAIEKAMSSFDQHKTPHSMLLLDIDDFKPINDTFGHDVGDNVLVKLVKLIQDHTREIDSLIRWGGEEFVLICPNVDIAAAKTIAESLRLRIAQTEFLPERQITCSFGIADYQGEGIEKWFKRADEALYNAKHNHKNCVVTA